MENKFSPGDLVVQVGTGKKYKVAGLSDSPHYRYESFRDYACCEPKDFNCELMMVKRFYEHEIRLANSVRIKRRLGVI